MTLASRLNKKAVVLFTGIGLGFCPALAGDAEIAEAQSVIDNQIRAFLSDDNATAYSFASPGIKQIFPTLDSFMNMVTRGYQPVWKPRAYSFGKSIEEGMKITQQLMVTGPDGKDYEAVYTLELQGDGTYKITGVSLRSAQTLGA
ncbi:MAG: DUF4864 domain-containing protein [Rhizobiaceae bacterium]